MRLLRLPHLRILPALTAIVIALAACGASARQTTIRDTYLAVKAADAAFGQYDADHRAQIVAKATSHENGVALLNEWDGTADRVTRDTKAAFAAIAAAATLNDDQSLASMLSAALIIKTELETLGVIGGVK